MKNENTVKIAVLVGTGGVCVVLVGFLCGFLQYSQGIQGGERGGREGVLA